MKRIFLFLLILITFKVDAQMTPWGIADTVVNYQVGPGIRHLKIHFPTFPLLMWVTEIDLNNPYNTIEQVQSNDKVPDTGRENVAAMSRRKTYPGHKVCAAFNHDFFSYDQGICIGLNINQGELTQRHSDGRSTFAITKDKTAHVFHPKLQAQVILPDKSTVTIDEYNWWALAHYGDCVLFNRFNALTLSDAGVYVKFRANGPWIVNGEPIRCTVVEVSEKPLQTSDQEYVLFARNNKKQAFSILRADDQIYISQNFQPGKFGIAPADILNAFHGYPSIAYEGKLHEGEYNDFEGGREYEKSSRLMAGMSEDGKKVYLYATELSTYSKGIDCVELANFMLAHGCWNIVNFDSGGSVAVVIDHTMQNLPGRGSVRPVADGLLCVSTAPEDNQIATYAFSNASLSLPAASLSGLRLSGYNQYGDLIEQDSKGFTFRCEPESLGYVDGDHIFHAAFKSMAGKIIAEKVGKSAEINVAIQPVTQVKLSDSVVLLDRVRNYPIHITGLAGAIERTLDPQAFEWTNSNPACCKLENGIVTGLENGTALLTGTLENVILSLKVIVETGKSEMIIEDFSDMDSFVITASSSFKNLNYTSFPLPANWTKGVRIGFDLVSGRFPSFMLEKPIRIYGIPDSLVLEIEVSDDLINKFYMAFNNLNGTQVYRYQKELSKGLNHLVIPFTPEENLIDAGQYPLVLSQINFSLLGLTKDKQAISIRHLQAYYPVANVTDITMPTHDRPDIKLVYDDYEMLLIGKVENNVDLTCKLYGLNGTLLLETCNQLESGYFRERIKFDLLPKGVYLLEVITGNERSVFKIKH